MLRRELLDRSTVLPGSPAARRLQVDESSWTHLALELASGGARLLSLWAEPEPRAVNAAFLCAGSALVLTLPLPDGARPYPSLAGIFPAAGRMQRAGFDLFGIGSDDADARAWIQHGTWTPAEGGAGRQGIGAAAREPRLPDEYPFVTVSGDGVHEIAVGPVHAGIIEPGHFRFSVVGEKVLRLEERLGYVHKGIERRFTELSPVDACRLAARVSGDSAVAYSWAYCQALEGLAGADVPGRAGWLRALALECERISNHLGDLGALGNDAGFAFGLAQFSRLKETWLRSVASALGQRYLLDFVVPGGVRLDPAAAAVDALAACAGSIGAEVRLLRTIYDEHAGVRDRFAAAGIVLPDLAQRLGLTGLAGRASGQDFDLRRDLPCAPYDRLAVRVPVRTEGDVYARVAVRFDELMESIRLVRAIADGLPAGAATPAAAAIDGSGAAAGMVEGWRGPVAVFLDVAAGGRIRRCHPHDPSWQNWPVLEYAIVGNIVPDFPLINKSFNLSYSGHDL